jgi:hypothetical protein
VREDRDLLAAQSRSPAPGARGQADVARQQLLTAAAQERVTGTRVVLVGQSRPDGAYARVELADRDGTVISLIYVTFYSKVPDYGHCYASPVLPRGEYTLTVTVLGEPTEWSDKRGERSGSISTRVTVDSALVLG